LYKTTSKGKKLAQQVRKVLAYLKWLPAWASSGLM